jgi:hypothetical protein
MALVLRRQMNTPGGFEITTDPQRPHAEHGFGALQAPTRPSHCHAVCDQVTAGAFDHVCRTGETRRQRCVVMHEVRILQEVMRTLIHRGHAALL